MALPKFKTSDLAKSYATLDPALRDALEQTPFPVTMTSGYRTPEQNKAVGGVPTSYHQHGKATDIRTRDLDKGMISQIVDHFKNLGWNPILESDHLHIEPGKTALLKTDDQNEPMPTVNNSGGNMEQPMPQASQPSMIEQLMTMLAPKKPSKLEALGQIFSSAAPIAASFHSPQSQARATEVAQNNFAQRKADQDSKVSQMLAAMKLGQPDNTDDMKEYDWAVKNGYEGSPYEYMLSLKTPQMDPMDKAVMGSPTFQNLINGGQAPAQDAPNAPKRFKFNSETGQLEQM